MKVPYNLRDHDRFHLLVDAVQDYAIYMLNLEGDITSWNTGAQRIKGYSEAEIIGRHFSVFFQPEDATSGQPDAILATALNRGRYEGEGWRVRRDGSTFWASVVVTLMRDEDGTPVGFAKVTHDQTRYRQQQLALEATERSMQEERDRLEVTLLSIADGVICTDAEGRVTMMNPVAEAMTGWPREEAMSHPVEEVFDLFLEETRMPVRNPIRDCLLHNRPFYLQDGVSLRVRNGPSRDVQDSAAPIHAHDGRIAGAVLVFQDVTRMRSIQREIAFSSTHDALTLLPNRRQFETALNESLMRTISTGTRSTVCFLDLDRFKVVNDTAGHTAGDVLLKSVAELLTRHVRTTDVIARLGGDEFAIILEDCTPAQAEPTLQRIMDAISALGFVWEERSFPISASLGVAEMTDKSDIANVMKQADVACYAAKNAGRNHMSVYHPDNGEVYDRHHQLQVASEIRDAIHANRFTLLAQPIVSTRGETAPRYELLLRMQDRKGEMISPGSFIPAAERYDLMADLDRWVLTQALERRGAALAAVPDLQLSINLSANSLNDAKFLPFFLDLLQRSPLQPSALTFEITETSLINNLLNASAVIEKVRCTGCKVALDDFGIGMSSFSYLRSFRVDFIKIEGSFVRNIPQSAVDMTIVRSINNIAHEVGAQTIAEFVEDDEILQRVTELGIDYAQGYAVGRPEPIESLLTQPAVPAGAC
ncbi:EAL domain-containing protein [Terriglobus roseus]|uniref:PAS domain S-box-containing protein/diguanylate cyclase (GGDEF) domain-containing protein n=1 Tax=Terriglobus roseus TaxID=392734 RepID=A0A1H4R5N9_9BACT|nr:EAL domain-containing protein [Terriglobus roseus]SEC27193.1 PAS domain S-box-containing protein/diguanylate cyclase (GGDEF) domain-containing protein [Terriglobus roseus]